MGYRKSVGTYRPTAGKGKSRTGGQMELHAHGKDKNEKATFLWLYILYIAYRINLHERARNKFGPITHPLTNG